MKGNGNLCKIEAQTGYADMAVGYKVGGVAVLTGQVASVTKPSADTTSLKTAVDAIIDNMKAKSLMA